MSHPHPSQQHHHHSSQSDRIFLARLRGAAQRGLSVYQVCCSLLCRCCLQLELSTKLRKIFNKEKGAQNNPNPKISQIYVESSLDDTASPSHKIKIAPIMSNVVFEYLTLLPLKQIYCLLLLTHCRHLSIGNLFMGS